MGQSNSVVKNEKKVQEHVPSDVDIISEQAFNKLAKSKRQQLQQQLEILKKVDQDIPTSKVQIQELIRINKQFYEPIKRPDLSNRRYLANGTFS